MEHAACACDVGNLQATLSKFTNESASHESNVRARQLHKLGWRFTTETSERGTKIAELFSSHTQLTDSHKPLEDLCKELSQSMSRESDELMTKLLHRCHLYQRGKHIAPLPHLQ